MAVNDYIRVVTKAKYAILSNGNKAKVVFARDNAVDGNTNAVTINYTITSTGSGNNTIDQSSGNITIPSGKENVQLDITNTGGAGTRFFTVTITSGDYTIDDETVDGSADYSSCDFIVTDVEPQLAFPTAYGSGAYVTGGRGGTIIHVTTTADTGTEGSLRWALTREYPRIIVFDVSGDFNLGGTVFLDNTSGGGRNYDHLTILGQTAPQGGVTIIGSVWMADVENVIIRYVRFYKENTFTGFDALTVGGTSSVIVDHVSAMNGSDEGISVTGYAQKDGAMTNVTMQNCLLSGNKTGTIFGSVTSREFGGQPCYINNVNINTTHRFPNTAGDGDIEVINNLVYNWGDSFRLVNIINACQLNHINNAYVGGAKTIEYGSVVNNTDCHKVNLAVDNTLDARVYTDGNFVTDLLDGTNTASEEWNLWTIFVTANGYTGGDPTPTSIQTTTQHPRIGRHYPIKSESWVRNNLISEVGANKTLNADGSVINFTNDVDTREKNLYINDTGGVYTLDVVNFDYGAGTPANSRPAGYYVNSNDIPETWFAANVPNGETSTDIAPSGYMWIEEFANQVDASSGNGAIPVITLTGASTINLTVGDTYTELGATATDAEDGTITNDIVTTGISNGTIMNSEGTFYTYYNVQDSDSNNAVQVTRTIVVSSAPIIPIIPIKKVKNKTFISII